MFLFVIYRKSHDGSKRFILIETRELHMTSREGFFYITQERVETDQVTCILFGIALSFKPKIFSFVASAFTNN